MRVIHALILSLALTVLASGAAFAVDTPQLMTCQGRLTDTAGTPYDGMQPVTFTVYNGAGTPLWNSGSVSVTFTSGLFTTILGASGQPPLPGSIFAADSNTTIGVTISTDPEISPRTRLVTVPYAFVAQTAKEAPAYLPLAGGSMSGPVTSTGDPAITMGKGNFGTNNVNAGAAAFVAGSSNVAAGDYAAVGGGEQNAARGHHSVVSGGGGDTYLDSNLAMGDWSTIGGGKGSFALGTYSTVSGGVGQYAPAYTSAIGGGILNHADSSGSTVAGGSLNEAGGSVAVVAGGDQNDARGLGAAVVGGRFNVTGLNSQPIWPTYGFIGGGYSNQAIANYASIVGGYTNQVTGTYATVGGGAHNYARGDYSVVAGGGWDGADSNSATGRHSCISGGAGHRAVGWYSSIPGGFNNTALGFSAFAAGERAKANHDGSFVWGDNTNADVASSGNNQFIARASGGVKFFSNSILTTGVQLAAGGGAWASVSDRNLKEHLAPVDPRAVLDAVAAMPISTWNYTSQDAAIRHIGPMAQDFQAAFQVGEDDRHITTIDADGVALAAIQGLNIRLQEKDREIDELRKETDELRRLVDFLVARDPDAVALAADITPAR